MFPGTVPAPPNPDWSKAKNTTGAADADVTPAASAALVASAATAIGVTHHRMINRRIGRSVLLREDVDAEESSRVSALRQVPCGALLT
jgi:hypothetical protein